MDECFMPCRVASPVGEAKNKNSCNLSWQEQSQKSHQSRLLGSTQPEHSRKASCRKQ